MMGLSAPLSTATINEGLSLLAAMANPAAVKQALTDIAEQTAALNKLRGEVTALQQAAQKERADADKAMAELNSRAAALDAREGGLLHREAVLAAFEREKAAIRNTITGWEAA